MVKKIFPLWVEEERIEKIKSKAKAQNRSANSFILNSIEQTPNLATGNWFDDPEVIRKVARELKRQMKK